LRARVGGTVDHWLVAARCLQLCLQLWRMGARRRRARVGRPRSISKEEEEEEEDSSRRARVGPLASSRKCQQTLVVRVGGGGWWMRRAGVWCSQGT
jgi:hypothetical protein